MDCLTASVDWFNTAHYKQLSEASGQKIQLHYAVPRPVSMGWFQTARQVVSSHTANSLAPRLLPTGAKGDYYVVRAIKLYFLCPMSNPLKWKACLQTLVTNVPFTECTFEPFFLPVRDGDSTLKHLLGLCWCNVGFGLQLFSTHGA